MGDGEGCVGKGKVVLGMGKGKVVCVMGMAGGGREGCVEFLWRRCSFRG